MLQYSSIVPTITVHQGKKMKIYLSDDLLISPFAEIKDRSYYANR
jgi:type IV secretory pathway VirB10-like protein